MTCQFPTVCTVGKRLEFSVRVSLPCRLFAERTKCTQKFLSSLGFCTGCTVRIHIFAPLEKGYSTLNLHLQWVYVINLYLHLNIKNPYLTLASKLEQSLFGKISTDPDQYMLANPVTYGISVLEFSLVTVLPDPDLPKIKSKQRRFGLVTEPCALFT
jgi:hypothetical protein